MGIVVVGVDGSRYGDTALQFAAEEAALRGATLRVVTAWDWPALEIPGDALTSTEVLPALGRAMSDDADGTLLVR